MFLAVLAIVQMFKIINFTFFLSEIILIKGLTHFHFAYMHFCFADLIKKSGKVAVITGGSRGIGLEVVKMLLQCDIHIIIGKKVVPQIKAL